MECLNGWARGEGQGHERGTDPHSRLVKTKENPEEQKIGRRGLVADPEERRTSVGAEAELEDWRIGGPRQSWGLGRLRPTR